MKPKIQILVGMISSGKSTYAKLAAQCGAVIINDDNIVNSVHANQYELYDPNLKLLYKTIENTTLSLALSLGKNVVIDRGVDVDPQSRKRWIDLARAYDVPIEAMCFGVCSPEIHAKRRYEADNRGHDYSYWLAVARKHYDSYSVPELNEGLTNVYGVVFAYLELKAVKGLLDA